MANKWDWADAAASEILCEFLNAPQTGYVTTLKSIANKLRGLHDDAHHAGYNLCRAAQLSENIEGEQR